MELADVEVMKPPTAARIDPAIEVTTAQLLKVENMPQVSDDDGDLHVPSITCVDDCKVEIVAVGEVPDQEDEYDTDSGNDMDDDDHDSYPHTTTLTKSGRAIRVHFRLDS